MAQRAQHAAQLHVIVRMVAHENGIRRAVEQALPSVAP